MEENNYVCQFYFENRSENRVLLFEKAIEKSQHGKVLFILQEELNELPEISQDLTSVDRNYIKMISFLYLPNLISLVDGISSLPNWQNVPSTIILDDLSKYCTKTKFQNVCGVVALVLDTAYSCSKTLNSVCELYISCSKDMISEENCKILKELYGQHEHENHDHHEIIS